MNKDTSYISLIVMQSKPIFFHFLLFLFAGLSSPSHAQELSDSLLYWQQNHNTQAICRTADRIIQGKEKQLNRCVQTEFLNEASRVAVDLFNPTQVLHYARQAQKTGCTDSVLIFQAIMREAIACNLLEKMDSAVLLTRRVISFAEATSNQDLLCSAHSNLGMMLNKQKNFVDAQKAFQRSMELTRGLNDPRRTAIAFLNISLCHLNLKTYDQGLSAIDSAILYAKQADIIPVLGHAMGLKSELFHAKHDIPNWLRTLDTAIELSTKSGNMVQAAFGLNDKFLHFLQEKEYPQAIAHGKKVLSIIEGGDQYPLLKNTYKHFYTLYKELDDKPAALYYLEKYTSLKDSLDQADYTQQIEELNLKFKVAENTNELNQQLLENKQQRIWVLSSLLAVLFFGGISFFLAWRTRSHKNTIRRLFIKERELEKEVSGLRKLLPKSHFEHPLDSLPPGESPELIRELALKIQQIVVEEKLFLQPDFSREKLAQQLGTNRSYLSQAINELDSAGFRTFMHKYRIQAAKELLWKIALNESDCTPQLVWQQTGFNSLKTYYRTFKAFTDLTPGEYLEQIALEIEQGKTQESSGSRKEKE